MNVWLLAAAVLSLVVGLVHSVLGEQMIFRKLRRPGHYIPDLGGDALNSGNVRILWAAWHALTVMGWAFAALVAVVGYRDDASSGSDLMLTSIAVAMAVSAGLVLVACKGRHLGWIGLLGIAVLIVLR